MFACSECVGAGPTLIPLPYFLLGGQRGRPGNEAMDYMHSTTKVYFLKNNSAGEGLIEIQVVLLATVSGTLTI